MTFVDELGKKIGGAYQIGKKILAGAVGLGHKVQSFAQSAPVQMIYRMLPPSIQAPLGTAYDVASKAIEGADMLQQKLNSGEQMARQVKTTAERVKSIELPRQAITTVVRPMEQGAGLRIPDKMITGGRRNDGAITTRTNMPMGPSGQVMTF
jgi:hypothetical protein